MANQTLTLDQADYRKIVAKLAEVGQSERSKAVSQALRKAENIFVSQGKINLRSRNKKRKGNLSGSFKVRTFPTKGKAWSGFSRPRGAAAHLVDRGTKDRYYIKNGKKHYTGSVSAGRPNTGSHFWLDAFESRKGEAVNVLITAIERNINNIVNKH